MAQPNQTIKINFDLDTNKLRSDISSAQSDIKGKLSGIKVDLDLSGVRSSVSSLSSLFTGLAAGISTSITTALISGVSNAVGSLRNLIGDSLDKAFNKEGMMTSLTTSLGGNISQAKEVYSWVKKIADSTPFSTEAMTAGFKNFISMAGVSVEKAKELTKLIGNAAVVANPLNPNQGYEELSSAYAKGAAGGIFYTEDINKYADKGIRIYQALSEVLGVTIQQVKQMAADGKITTDVFDAGLRRLNESGQQLNGQMDALGKTSIGMASTMSDAMDSVKVKAGEALQPAVNAGMKLITEVFSQIESSGVFDELNASALEFANYLKENPQLVQQLTAATSQLIREGLSVMANLAKQTIEWLSKPETMTGLIEGAKTFGTVMKATIDVFATIAGWVGNIVNGLQQAAAAAGQVVAMTQGANGNAGQTSNAEGLNQNQLVIRAGLRIGEGQGTQIALDNRVKGNYAGFGTDYYKQASAPNQFVAFNDATAKDRSSDSAFAQYMIRKYGKAAIAQAIRDNEKTDLTDQQVVGNRTSFRTQGTVRGGNYTNYKGNSFLNEEQWDGVDRRPKTVNNATSTTSNTSATSSNTSVSTVRPNTNTSASTPKSQVVVQRTGQKDANGMEILNVETYDKDGKLISRQVAYSGVPTTQGLYGKKTSAGSLAPLPYGSYQIGETTNQPQMKGVEGQFIDLNPKNVPNIGDRGGFGIHRDAGGLGSAGCLVFKSAEDFNKFQNAVKAAGANTLNFKDGVAAGQSVQDNADKIAEQSKRDAEALRSDTIKAQNQKQDSDIANQRKIRDANLKQQYSSPESANLLSYINDYNSINDKYADVVRKNKRDIDTLNEDSVKRPSYKANNDLRIKALEEEIRVAKETTSKELDLLRTKFDGEIKKQVEAQKLKNLKGKQDADNLELAAQIAGETDANKKATLEYQKQKTEIEQKYQAEREAILKEIALIEAQIKEYEKLGLSTSTLKELRDQYNIALGNNRRSEFADQSILGSNQAEKGRSFLSEIDSGYGSSVGSYLQRTDQFAYNDFQRNRGRQQIDRQTQSRLGAAQSMFETGAISAEEFIKVKKAIDDISKADISNLNAQFQTLGQTIATTVAQGLGEAFMSIIDGSKKAGEAMLDFLKKIASQLLNMAMNQLISKLLGGLFGGGGGLIGGLFGGITGGTGSFASAGDFLGGSSFGLGSISIPGFATGGVVDKPTIAKIGEGAYSEAVVPLPDGRRIPVQMSNTTRGNVANNITVNVDAQGNSKVKYGSGDKLAKDLSNVIDQRVRWHKKNPGGLLYGN